MQRLKPTEAKALAWFAEENNFKVQLSTYPTMYFLDEDGKERKELIYNIIRKYKERKKF